MLQHLKLKHAKVACELVTLQSRSKDNVALSDDSIDTIIEKLRYSSKTINESPLSEGPRYSSRKPNETSISELPSCSRKILNPSWNGIVDMIIKDNLPFDFVEGMQRLFKFHEATFSSL